MHSLSRVKFLDPTSGCREKMVGNVPWESKISMILFKQFNARLCVSKYDVKIGSKLGADNNRRSKSFDNGADFMMT